MKKTADVKQGRTARKENVAKRQRAAAKTKDTAEFGHKFTARGKTVADKEDGVLQEMIRLLDYQENLEKNQTAHNAGKGTARLNNFESDEDYIVETDTSRVSDFDPSGFSDSYHFDFDEEEPMVTDELSRFPLSSQGTKQTAQKVEKGTASVNDFDPCEEEPMVPKLISFSDSSQETKQTTQKVEKEPLHVYDLDSDEVELITTQYRQYKRVFESDTKKTELTQNRADKPTSVFDSDSEGESIAEEKLSNSVSTEETIRTFGERIIPAPLSIGDDNKRDEPRYKFFDSDSEEKQPTQKRPNEPSNVFDSDSKKQESEPKLTGEPSNFLDADSDVEFIAEEKVEVIDVFDSDSEPEEMARNDALSIPRHDLSDAEIAQYRLLHAYDFSLSSKAMAERAARKQAAKERRMEDGIVKRKRKRGQKTTPPAKKRKCSESRYVLPVKTPEIRDLFLSLPWSHVIWQHVLPFLRVVDKFRLRAVNTHCKGVVKRDFSMALSILPPSRPQMNRVAWSVLTGGNRCAIRFTAPVFRREIIYNPFFFSDLVEVLKKKTALRYLSLSHTRVCPNYFLLKTIAKRFPDLEELHLQGLQNVSPLMNAELNALTTYEMTRLHTLDLSRNSHDIRLSILQDLVETQKSLRVLAIDAKPIVDKRVGVLQELADLWLYSDLERLTLTRTPPDSKCGLRHCRCAPNCRCIPGPLSPSCTLTMADALFIKTTDPDGRIVKKFLYTDCFSLGELGVDRGRYIPEDELRDQGVEVRSQPCTVLYHLYQELLFKPNTVLP
ncbi:uncharacterized protein [Littorina saxatilis]|uniref:uncharacterized protein n=1 Tax=Littorina saxatilis TaxID=31220 RepID=UPI0038B4DA7E